MSWVFNINVKSIIDWVTATEPNVHRLLVTHTDLDGYGCVVMARGMLTHNNSDSKSPVTVSHVYPGKDGEAVSMYVNNPENNYRRGEDELFILITDLGSINLMFYSNMIKSGHKLRMIVVDHHQTTFTDMFDEELCMNACDLSFFHSDAKSATGLMGDLWDETELKGYSPDFYRYGSRVSKYDTGKWSNDWTSDDFDIVKHHAPEVIEQLRFIAYRKKDLMDRYVSDAILMIEDVDIAYNAVCDQDVKMELNALMAEYNRFINSFGPLSTDFVTVPLFKCYLSDNQPFLAAHPNYSVHGIVVKDETENYDYFSMISRKVLEENDDIDILVLVNCVRGKVELRAAKNSIDLSKIAKTNGGGGHPKAAGFPLPQAFSAK